MKNKIKKNSNMIVLIISLTIMIIIFYPRFDNTENCDTCEAGWGKIQLTTQSEAVKIFNETIYTNQFLPENYPTSDEKNTNIYGFTQEELNVYLNNPEMTYSNKQNNPEVVMYPFLNLDEKRKNLNIQRLIANTELKEFPSDHAKTILTLDSSKGRIVTLAKLYDADNTVITIKDKNNIDESYIYIVTKDNQYGFIKTRYIQ